MSACITSGGGVSILTSSISIWSGLEFWVGGGGAGSSAISCARAREMISRAALTVGRSSLMSSRSAGNGDRCRITGATLSSRNCSEVGDIGPLPARDAEASSIGMGGGVARSSRVGLDLDLASCLASSNILGSRA